jgi:septum formation protein
MKIELALKKTRNIVLASASPRRIELLTQIGVDFTAMPSSIEETINNALSPDKIVQELSLLKAQDVSNRLNGNSLVIGADTIVYKNTIFGKPKNEQDAFNMLQSLSGVWHEVFTGIALIDLHDKKIITSYERTLVKMRSLTHEDILSYLRTGDYIDKAGGYGIQSIGALLIDRINGCYFNVVGLPIVRLCEELKKFKIDLLQGI